VIITFAPVIQNFTWAKEDLGHVVGPTRDDLALEVPAVDPAVAGVASAGHHVAAGLGLLSDELRNELGLQAKKK
jgi:hypothetical protein